MKRLTFISLVIAAIVAFSLPTFAASSGSELTQGEDVALADLVEVESVETTDASVSTSPDLFADSFQEEILNECSGGGATCRCSGSCEADSDGCSCT